MRQLKINVNLTNRTNRSLVKYLNEIFSLKKDHDYVEILPNHTFIDPSLNEI